MALLLVSAGSGLDGNRLKIDCTVSDRNVSSPPHVATFAEANLNAAADHAQVVGEIWVSADPISEGLPSRGSLAGQPICMPSHQRCVFHGNVIGHAETHPRPARQPAAARPLVGSNHWQGAFSNLGLPCSQEWRCLRQRCEMHTASVTATSS